MCFSLGYYLEMQTQLGKHFDLEVNELLVQSIALLRGAQHKHLHLKTRGGVLSADKDTLT